MSPLSQRDIDNLVAILDYDHSSGMMPSAPGIALRAYDFRRPDKFSKDALRVLQFLHENFARSLTTFLSGQIRSMVTAFMSSVDQMTFEEYCRLIPNPCVAGMVRLAPLPSTALLELHPSLAFPIIDRLFGGPGRQHEQLRTLTDIEQTVVWRLLSGILRVLAESWTKVEQITPQMQAIETNPLFAQVLAPNETVVVITLEVKLGDHTGPLNLVLPHLLMEPVLPKLSAHQWFGVTSAVDQGGGDAGMTQGLLHVQVDLAAILGSCPLTVGELLCLEAGDVLHLQTPADGEVRVLVGEEMVFTGKLGRRGKKLAVEIRSFQGGNGDE